jgi:hypothetical protein
LQTPQSQLLLLLLVQLLLLLPHYRTSKRAPLRTRTSLHWLHCCQGS